VTRHELRHSGCAGTLMRIARGESCELVCSFCGWTIHDPREIQHTERIAPSPEDQQTSRWMAMFGYSVRGHEEA
jgi:hypothetical protein